MQLALTRLVMQSVCMAWVTQSSQLVRSSRTKSDMTGGQAGLIRRAAEHRSTLTPVR